MLLPVFRTLPEYRPLFRDDSVWRPALQAICARHGLDASSLRIAPPGSNIVYWVEDHLLIKLFVPLWPEDAAREIAILGKFGSFDAFDIPRIYAQGELEGWPYLVIEKLSGQPLDEVWDGLSFSDRLELAASLGQCIAALQAFPTAGLDSILEAWPADWEAEIDGCLARQRELGVSTAWQGQIASFLRAALPDLQAPYRPTFLHADLNPEHLFCQETASGWQVTGIIDFADAMLGHPLYEWSRPAFTLRFEPTLIRAMFSAAGFPPAALNANLSRSLLAITMLHRFFSLPELLAQCRVPPADLAELQTALLSFA